MWTDSLLDHIDCTPAQWIDPPTVGGINSTGPVQPQPAVPTSGALQAIQSLINTHPSTRITKKSLGGLKTVLMNDRYANASQKEKLMCQNAEHVRIVLAIESLVCKHNDLEAAVSG
ncbi:unnamed protein product [Boreogadus saida]